MITLKNDKLTVEIANYGAEIKSIKTADGVEYMWQGGGEFWEGTAPNLFPIVGRLNDQTYTIGGEKYTLGCHGFGWVSEFDLVENTENSAIFELKASEEIKKGYPYDFVFRVSYVLINDTIKVEYKVENVGDKSLFYSVGAHPGFNVPLHNGGNFNQYYLEFDKPHTPTGYELTPDGFITGKTEPFYLINDTILPLAGQEIFVPTVFLENMATTVTLKSDKTRRQVSMTYEGFRFLALWHDDNAPYICIEPWTGTPDYKNQIRELSDKNAITELKPAKTDRYSYTITIK